MRHQYTPREFYRRYKDKIQASQVVKRARLHRPDTCQLCNLNVVTYNLYRDLQRTKPARIVAHHYNGYDHPLDVWFICHHCNMIVREHDGSLTLDQARAKYHIHIIQDTQRYAEAAIDMPRAVFGE